MTRCPGTCRDTTASSVPSRPLEMCWTPRRGPSSALQVQSSHRQKKGVRVSVGLMCGSFSLFLLMLQSILNSGDMMLPSVDGTVLKPPFISISLRRHINVHTNSLRIIYHCVSLACAHLFPMAARLVFFNLSLKVLVRFCSSSISVSSLNTELKLRSCNLLPQHFPLCPPGTTIGNLCPPWSSLLLIQQGGVLQQDSVAG